MGIFRNENKLLTELFMEQDRNAQFLDAAVYIVGKSVTLQYLTDEGDIRSAGFAFSTDGLNAVREDLELTATNWRANWGDSFDLLIGEAEARGFTVKPETFWVKLSNDKEELFCPYSKPGLAQFRHALKIWFSHKSKCNY